jgi:hypothetical protein
MRTLILFFVAISLAQASFGEPYLFKDSEVAENIFVRIDLVGGNTNLTAEKKITFGFLEKTNEIMAPTIYFPKPEYLCQMQLLDSNGIAVTKTRIGEKYGEQFSELKSYSWESVNKRGHNTGGSDRPDMTLLHTEGTESRELPAVNKLFKIKHAGNYKLLLQFQVFKRIGNGPNHTFKIVHIPKVEIPIVKAQEF